MPDMEVCAECNTHIADQFVLRVGESSLHQECLKCASCRTPLTDSCFSKFGQFYCRQDFYRMFGPRCSACQLVFAETDKARKIGESLFHTHCFTCRDCSANLTEGDKAGCDHRGNLFCEIDYIKHINGSSAEFLLSTRDINTSCWLEAKGEDMKGKTNYGIQKAGGRRVTANGKTAGDSQELL